MANIFVTNTCVSNAPPPPVTAITAREVDVIITAGTSIENQTNDTDDTEKWGRKYVLNKYGRVVEILDIAVGGSRIQELVETLAGFLALYADRKNVTLMLNHGFNDTNGGPFLSRDQATQDQKIDDLRYVYDYARSAGWFVIQGSITHSFYVTPAFPNGAYEANPADIVETNGVFNYIRDWIVPIMQEYTPALLRNDATYGTLWPVVNPYDATRNEYFAYQDVNDQDDFVHPGPLGRLVHWVTQLDGVMETANGQTPPPVLKRNFNTTPDEGAGIDIVFGFAQANRVTASSANINWVTTPGGTYDDGLYIDGAVNADGNDLLNVKLYGYADIVDTTGPGNTANSSDDSATLTNNVLLSNALGKTEDQFAGNTAIPAMHFVIEGLLPVRRYFMQTVAAVATGTKNQYVFLHNGNDIADVPIENAGADAPQNRILTAEFVTDHRGRALVAIQPITDSSRISGIRIYSNAAAIDGSTLSLFLTGTPNGTYTADFLDTVSRAKIASLPVTFAGQRAEASLLVEAGRSVDYVIFTPTNVSGDTGTTE